jgi:hypothetical protein
MEFFASEAAEPGEFNCLFQTSRYAKVFGFVYLQLGLCLDEITACLLPLIYLSPAL